MASELISRLDGMATLEVRTADGCQSVDPRGLASALSSQFRAEGFTAGEAMAVTLPNGPGFAVAFIACLREGLTFVPLNPGLASAEIQVRLKTADVAGILTDDGKIVRLSQDSTEHSEAHATVTLFTSGTGGDVRAIALGEAGLLSVVDSHHAALDYPRRARITGCLPWTHAFGFTLEFLMALLNEGALRSVSAASLLDEVTEHPPDVLFGVPRTVAALPDAVLGSLATGIVGGAPVRGQLRERLKRTRLRVGYGQTECSPGVSLGQSGEWERDDFLGRPVGCEVKLGEPDSEGARELYVKGPNTALASLGGGRPIPVIASDGWLATGDLALGTNDGGFVFQGRRDERFKLSNGRMVNPIPLEQPYGDQVVLIGAGHAMVQPLLRGEVPHDFTLPVPYAAPRVMPENFWAACMTTSGKISRRRAEQLFASS